MGLPININDILAGRSVEWERLEFKEGWTPEAVLHTLCAFANDYHNLDGGYVIVGVAESDGRPVLPPAGLPLNSLDGIQKKLVELGNRIQPPYHPICEPYEVEGKHILVLRAPGGQNRPYKAPINLARDNRVFAYYIRRNSCSVQANSAEELELMTLAAKVPFDDRIRQDASLDDLDGTLILAHLNEIDSDLVNEVRSLTPAAMARKMAIADGPNENLRPRNVGLMFFNPHPEAFFPQTQIDVVQFPDGPGGNTIIEKTFKGPLGRQLTAALDYINSIIVETRVIKRQDRAEADRVFNYPYPAIEELLVNAVYHRSYETREPIEMRVLPDHITITSYPGPDRSISLDDLKSGNLVARRYRNRRIGEFLKELHLTEGRGTGIPKVIRAMEQNGSPRPEFRTDEERSFFTATLPMRVFQAAGSPTVPGKDEQLSYAERMAERAFGTLQYLERAEVLTRGMYELLFKVSESQAKRNLAYLVSMGWIERKGASTGIYYVMTGEGEKELHRLQSSGELLPVTASRS